MIAPPKAAQGIMTKEMQEDDATADLLEGEQPTLRRIFFDFDQTISRCHVFKLLAGWEKSSLPAPFALTDRGQISKIASLNAQGRCWGYSETNSAIISVESNGDLWTTAALGGAARVERLRSLFRDLRAKGIVLTVITKGYVGAVRMLLQEEQLLDSFETVIGFIDKYYGDSEYDKACKVSSLEGGADNALMTSKADFIKAVLHREVLLVRQAVLVEDDPSEIASVRQPLICRGVFVRKRQGMMSTEMERLHRIAGLPSIVPPLASAAPGAPPAPPIPAPPKVPATPPAAPHALAPVTGPAPPAGPVPPPALPKVATGVIAPPAPPIPAAPKMPSGATPPMPAALQIPSG